MMQTLETEPADANGRDQSGKFSAGNAFGRGNPVQRHAQRLRQLFVQAVTEDDVTAIVRKLVSMAVDGDVQAANLLLTRALGKPSTSETTLGLDDVPILELEQVTNIEQAREYCIRKDPEVTAEDLRFKAGLILRTAKLKREGIS